MTLFHRATSFETTMKVFHGPTHRIPVHTLPRLFHVLNGDGGEQDPLQWLFAGWRQRLPDAYQKGRHRLLAERSPILGRLDLDLGPADLQKCLTRRAIMKPGKIFRTAIPGRQAACEVKQASHFLIVFFYLAPDLHAAVLCGADQKILAEPSDVLSEAEDICPTISHMHPLA